jgi:hypothetical protein
MRAQGFIEAIAVPTIGKPTFDKPVSPPKRRARAVPQGQSQNSVKPI